MTGDWLQQRFDYCERGVHAGLLAEPINALSNVAFLAAALAILALARRQQARPRLVDLPGEVVVMAGLAVGVGLASTMFHTTAARWAQAADVGSIGLFMVSALAVTLRRAFDWRKRSTALAVALLLGAMAAAAVALETVGCRADGPEFAARAALPRACGNGSYIYLPALAALIAVTVGLWRCASAATGPLLSGAILFALALAARSLDIAVCPWVTAGPLRLTGHALWHVGCAATAFAILNAVLRLTTPDRASSARTATRCGANH